MNNKEIWEFVVKMDDYIYITQMELAYKNISNDNTEVNQKAGIMIGIIGVMFSIQSTIIVSLYPFTNILSYIFIGSLFCYLISIVYFIKNLSVEEYLLNLKTKQVIAGKLAGPGQYVSRKQSINKNVEN